MGVEWMDSMEVEEDRRGVKEERLIWPARR